MQLLWCQLERDGATDRVGVGVLKLTGQHETRPHMMHMYA